LELVIAIVFILYSFLLIWLMIGWRRAMQQVEQKNSDQPFISIIIPMRNEALNIASLLNDLTQQTYSYFEILMVDDHSEDDTPTVIFNVVEKSPSLKDRVRILTCTHQAGKKAALTLGIQKAKGEIILTTDADCRVNRGWLQATVNQFSFSTMMVVGGVRLTADTFFETLQQLEFASLIGSGAATLGWNLPSMANGANLAFRKAAFVKVNGYSGNEHIPSGDDEFLLRKIHAAYPHSVVVNAQSKSVVETKSSKTVYEFLQQRLRWAGKWNLHKGLFSKLLAIGVFLFQVTFLLVPWFMLVGVLAWSVGVSLLFGKALLEYVFFKPIVRQQSFTFPWPAFLSLQFIYPYYVVVVALKSVMYGYEWKGRRF
jgi:poly-beta-1,6-N-acetyl-D-glucosamine synthase